MSAEIVPLDLGVANDFVERVHRHHGRVTGHKFSIGIVDPVDGRLRGVAIVGRPVARGFDDGWALEVTRVATDGMDNACSALYAAAWRSIKAQGYRKLITYTLDDESGASLRAAGWVVIHEVKGRSWSCESRPRIDKHPTTDKLCWAPREVAA